MRPPDQDSLSFHSKTLLQASHFDYEYVLGHKIVFICVARGKPRPKIVWFKDGRELYDHNYLHVSKTHFHHRLDKQTSKSLLKTKKLHMSK